MKAGLTEMVFILDRSGSMSGLEDETIGGYNSLIEKQRKEPGEARVTTVLFDNDYELLHDCADVRDLPPLTDKEYYPRGSTALLDAVGRTINAVGRRLSETPEEERPEQVIVVITTDGYENSSREFSKRIVKEMIRHQQEKYSWTFIFLGANIDAVGEAESLGISAGFSRTYTASNAGVRSVYSSLSQSMSSLREASTSFSLSQSGNGASTDASYGQGSSTSVSLEEARKKAMKALDGVE